MSNPEKIITNLTSSHGRRQVLYEMSVGQFFKLEWPLVPKRSGEDWFLFKTCQITPENTTISIDKEPVDLFYGGLHTLKENEKSVGFLVNTPSMTHNIQSDFLISSPKATKIENLANTSKVFLITSSFSVIILDDTVQYIAAFNRPIQNAFT
jgi:hypothetical protein